MPSQLRCCNAWHFLGYPYRWSHCRWSLARVSRLLSGARPRSFTGVRIASEVMVQ